jgi:predicted dehydrogenase
MIGAGGFAGAWIRRFLPPFADRLEVVGLVDVSDAALTASGDFLDLAPHQRFQDMARAFETVDADFCVIVIPPAFHKEAVLHAVARRLPILSEKPIADSWEACRDVYLAVKEAGVKMQVVQNYRYTPALLTTKQVLREGTLGRVNYVMARFAADYRGFNSWGAAFRHQIPHALLVEGGVHHFDSIRTLTGGDCATIAGWEWNPAWSSSRGEFCNLFLMRMTNDVRVAYEGNGTAAGAQNTWHDESYRVECEEGVVAVGRDRITRIERFRQGSDLVVEEVPAIEPRYPGHQWIVDEFLTWLEGGPTPATVIDDNIKSVAMVFGAIEASRTGQSVNVAAMLDFA